MSRVDISQFHEDPLSREELIRKYLTRKLDADSAEAFESHYLCCDQCFEELRTSQALMAAFGRSKVEFRRVEDVLVVQFVGPSQLTRESFELEEFQRAFQQ